MPIGLSSIEIEKRLRGKTLPGQSTIKITESRGKKSVSDFNAKRIMKKELRQKSERQREKWYKGVDLNYDEKNRLEKIYSDNKANDRPSMAMIREEKMKKRANVIGGRSIARRLEEQRGGASDKNKRTENRLDRALVGIDEKGRRTKTGFATLGLKQKEYEVTKFGGDIAKRSLTSSLESKSHLTFAGQNNDGGIASIDDRAKNATSITGGVGAIKKLNMSGGGLDGNRGGRIPLSKAA